MSTIGNNYTAIKAHVQGVYDTSNLAFVLLVGDAQPFDLEVPARYNTCFDENLFQRLLQGQTREQRWAALRGERISHVYVDWNEIDRYRQPGNYGFTDYVTRRLVRDELVAQQGLLRPVPLPLNPQAGELFEVVAIHATNAE